MFTSTVDDEIQLALVQDSFALNYATLVQTQLDYLSQWLAWPPYCQSEQAFTSFIQGALHEYAEGKSITCAILFNGVIVGNCSLNNINRSLQRADIGYWLSQDYQGKGIVTRSVQALIKIAFNDLDLEKVQLSAAVENHSSRQVAERLGMVLEGIITRNEKVGDRVLDHAIYALSRCK